MNFQNVDELIECIGLDGYYSLVEKDWGEEFDYSASKNKTHRKKCV
jgi:hypothetical protein